MEFFLVDWRSRLCWKLTENTCGCLQSRHPAVAQTVPTSFPDLEVVRLYTSPITSIAPFVSEKPWINRNANLRKLSQLCNQTFSWQVLKIENKFERLVWIGICFRQVVEVGELRCYAISWILFHIFVDCIDWWHRWSSCAINPISDSSTSSHQALWASYM